MNTGYIIKQYIDINPLSPTYNQTWTERVLDTDHCPQSADDWVEIANYCEIVASGYTGNRQIMYYSDSLNAYSSVTRPDTSCTPSSSEEQWVNDGEPYCEQVDGKNTGYMIQKQIQKNINLVNYGETREMKYQSDECGEPTPTGDTCPHWQEIMRYCNIINDSGTTLMDGTSNVAQIDNNPNSSRYNETRTINVYDSGCSNMVGATFEWVEVGDYCGNSEILCNEGMPMVKTTLYTVYRRRKTINGTTTNMDELSAVTKEIGSEQCGADIRRQWVRTDDTECVDASVKATLTLNDGSTVTISGSGVLTSGETSGYSATCVSAEITTACTSIGNRAFYRYSGLTSINIPNSVTSIGNSAFNECSGLTSVTISNSVTSIGDYAFIRCSSLASVTIPSGVTSIGDSLFSRCSSLTSVTIPNGVTSIGNSAFDVCYSLTSVTIPNSVTSIGSYAFQGCSGLTNITIPSGVTIIGYSAFEYCTGLTEINVSATTPPTLLGNYVFDSTNDCPIYVPCASVDAYKTAWSAYESRITCVPTYKARLTLNDGSIVTISGSGELTTGEVRPYSASCVSAEIGSDCTSIGQSAFLRFSGLTSVIIGDSVTSIGPSAFYSGSSLTSVIIGNSVATIGSNAFIYCSSLTSVTIPNSVTSIGNHAFSNCSRLTSVSIPNSVTSIGEAVFQRCSSLASITIPNSVTDIGMYAFYGCSGLTSIAIPNYVATIGNYAFSNCRGLTSVSIPNSVTSVGERAFEYCTGLTEITVEATTPPTLGNDTAFWNTNNCPIYVPAESVNAYKTATYWSTYASRITAIP